MRAIGDVDLLGVLAMLRVLVSGFRRDGSSGLQHIARLSMLLWLDFHVFFVFVSRCCWLGSLFRCTCSGRFWCRLCSRCRRGCLLRGIVGSS